MKLDDAILAKLILGVGKAKTFSEILFLEAYQCAQLGYGLIYTLLEIERKHKVSDLRKLSQEELNHLILGFDTGAFNNKLDDIAYNLKKMEEN